MNGILNQTSLDNLSTSRPTPPAATYRDHKTQYLKAEYVKAYDYYVGNVLKSWNFRGQRFVECHTRAVFARNTTTHQVRVLANSCHLRFCPLCNDSRRRLIQRNVIDWLKNQRYPKFLTLTLKSEDIPLPEQIDRLYKSFQLLRRRSMLKKKVSSGIWFFQITKNQKTGLWHPHLHCLLTGSYIPRREIQRQWYAITGDSHQVDIRLIHDSESAALEVARYASCSVNIKAFDNFELQELDDSLRNRRICGSWGKCKKQRLLSPPKYEDKQWEKIGSWSTVVNNLNEMEEARLIYNAWKNNQPLSAGITLVPFEDAIRNRLENYEVVVEESG